MFTISGPPSTFDGERKIGGTDLVGKYNGVFGSRFLVQGMVARHEETDKFAGAGRDIPNFIDQTVRPNATSGGFGFFQDQDFNRNVVKGDVTMYLGGHDIKVGGDYEHISAVNNNYNGGAGQRIYKLSTLPEARASSTTAIAIYVNDRAPGFDRPIRSTWTDRAAAHLGAGLGQHLVLRAGQLEGRELLHDQRRHPLGRRRTSATATARRAFKLDQNWAPRVGFIWDVTHEQPQQGLRELGPLLREHPDGHQHPRVRRRAPVLLLQLRSRARRTTMPDPSAPRRNRACSAAAPNRSIRT